MLAIKRKPEQYVHTRTILLITEPCYAEHGIVICQGKSSVRPWRWSIVAA